MEVLKKRKNEDDIRSSVVQELPVHIATRVSHGQWPSQMYEHIAVKTEQAWKLDVLVAVINV